MTLKTLIILQKPFLGGIIKICPNVFAHLEENQTNEFIIYLFIYCFSAVPAFLSIGAAFLELAVITADSSLWPHKSGLLIFITLLVF